MGLLGTLLGHLLGLLRALFGTPWDTFWETSSFNVRESSGRVQVDVDADDVLAGHHGEAEDAGLDLVWGRDGDW